MTVGAGKDIDPSTMTLADLVGRWTEDPLDPENTVYEPGMFANYSITGGVDPDTG